jgi:hypothetical protein
MVVHRQAAWSLFIACLLALPLTAWALDHRHEETFDTLDACDTEATTAWWDTADGALKLPAFTAEITGAWNSPGLAYGVARAGRLAYVADGAAGLQIIDVGDPASPVALGTVDTPGAAWGVAVAGSVAYVADYTGHLQVIDVGDPALPVVLGTAAVDQPLMRLAVAGDHVYGAAREAGLVVIDVSDPAAPVVLAYADTPGTAFGVALAGDHAYLADAGVGLQVVDITDPAAPQLVGALTTGHVVYGVAVQGDLACLTDLVDGLVAIDVSDPTAPVRLGSLALPSGAWDVTLAGNLAYVCGGGHGVHVIDLGDPMAPVLLENIDTPGSARGAVLHGRHLTVADYNSGLQMLAVREARETPALASALPLPGSALSLAVDGGLACVASGAGGLLLVGIDDPGQPEILSSLGAAVPATAVLLAGNRAYVVNAVAAVVADITDPSAPAVLGSCATGGAGEGLALAGDVLYVAAADAGLVAVDVADASTPVVIGSLATPGTARAVALAGDLAYVADGPGGLAVVDIADPATPSLLASVAVPGTARSVTVDGERAFVVTDQGDLHVADVSDPAAPSVVTSLAVADVGHAIASAGDLLLVAAGPAGLQVVDVTSPDAPALLGALAIAGDCLGVAVQGDLVHTACAEAGLVTAEVFTRSFLTGPNLARSLPFGDPAYPVRRVRLTAAQADSIAWLATAAADDTTFSDVAADGTWHRVAGGGQLRWQATLHATEPGSGPRCEHLTVEWLHDTAVIDTIADAPDDQDGLLRLSFTRSALDFDDEQDNPVLGYRVWRRQDQRQTGRDGPPPGNWEEVAAIAAARQDTYAVTVPTVQDSLVTVFCVVTATADPTAWSWSPPDSAFAFDDLPPAVPTGVQLSEAGLLTWDDPQDDQIAHWSVYGSTTPDLADAVLLAEPVEPQHDVSAAPHDFYLVTATDHAGNQSEAAVLAVGQTASPDTPPSHLALLPPAPNPFNPRTTLSFALPVTSHVRLQVHDLGGRLVATLVDRVLGEGRHEVGWDGRDHDGRVLPSGVYLTRLEAGAEVARGRLTLVR